MGKGCIRLGVLIPPTCLGRAVTHFQWEGPPAHAHDIAIGTTSEGWLGLTAVDSFFFKHHGGFAITPGIDSESHANTITDCD
jgi:hypothetical protein